MVRINCACVWVSYAMPWMSNTGRIFFAFNLKVIQRLNVYDIDTPTILRYVTRIYLFGFSHLQTFRTLFLSKFSVFMRHTYMLDQKSRIYEHTLRLVNGRKGNVSGTGHVIVMTISTTITTITTTTMTTMIFIQTSFLPIFIFITQIRFNFGAHHTTHICVRCVYVWREKRGWKTYTHTKMESETDSSVSNH